jgi:hypothetical protein
MRDKIEIFCLQCEDVFNLAPQLSLFTHFFQSSTMSNLPEADWNRHKENIRQLYCVEQKDLPRVREEMKQLHEFNATYAIIISPHWSVV